MICSFEGASLSTFLDSSMVEHSAVNRVVAGSSPARGAVKSVSKSLRIFCASRSIKQFENNSFYLL